eukprot:4030660-Karenia_brevis.AAC.1
MESDTRKTQCWPPPKKVERRASSLRWKGIAGAGALDRSCPRQSILATIGRQLCARFAVDGCQHGPSQSSASTSCGGE